MDVPHYFMSHAHKFPKLCDHCGWLLFGFFQQGKKCKNCSLFVHKHCQKKVNNKCCEKTEELDEISNAIVDSIDEQELLCDLNSSTNSIIVVLSQSTSSIKESTRNASRSRRERHFGIIPIYFGRRETIDLDDYNFVKLLGKGAFGKVMLAEKKGTNDLYAIKTIKKADVISSGDINHIKTEKRILTLASKYPFLIGLHSCFQTTDRLFFVMEYLSGGSIFYHLQKEYTFDESRARIYAAEVTLALLFLHRHDVIYCNLNLKNILLDREGHCKLVDFTMCKEGIVNLGVVKSTFRGNTTYIAPETLDGFVYESSVDWWALGSIMYEMMVGEAPFGADNQSDLYESILFGDFPCPLWLTHEAICLLKGLMKKDPTRRLGCSGNEIRTHIFFNGLDWRALEQRRIEPPFQPNVDHTNPKATLNFDSKYTQQDPVLTPVTNDVVNDINQEEFAFFQK